MAYTDLLLNPIQPGSSDFLKWAVAVAWVQAACVNAGITIPPAGNKSKSNDGRTRANSDLAKWQKLVAWLSLLANNISGGVPPALTSIQAGNVALTTGVSATGPSPSGPRSRQPRASPAIWSSSRAEEIQSSSGHPTLITTAGFTAQWGFAVPAGYSPRLGRHQDHAVIL